MHRSEDSQSPFSTLSGVHSCDQMTQIHTMSLDRYFAAAANAVIYLFNLNF